MLIWKENTDHIHKRLHGRMYCLRKLKFFHVREEILQMFYSSVVGSIICFGMTCANFTMLIFSVWDFPQNLKRERL